MKYFQRHLVVALILYACSVAYLLFRMRYVFFAALLSPIGICVMILQTILLLSAGLIGLTWFTGERRWKLYYFFAFFLLVFVSNLVVTINFADIDV